jgi:anti-sigma factor RsiW
MGESYSRAFNARELVSAHVRSLMADNLVQVTSSDTHTVRPWFAGKIDFAPDVTDFAREGFPLIGGRVDYVGGAKAAVLVYGHNQHVINVFVSPAQAMDIGSVQQSRKNGYTIVAWRKGDLRYRAISDLNASELADFVRKLDASAQN